MIVIGTTLAMSSIINEPFEPFGFMIKGAVEKTLNKKYANELLQITRLSKKRSNHAINLIC